MTAQRTGPKPHSEQRGLLIPDVRPFATRDMPSTLSMDLQPAFKQQLRLHMAGTHHVLLTFLNDNPPQIMAYQQTPIDLKSSGN